MIVQIYAEHCNSGLFKLKFHFLDHVEEDLTVFRTLSVYHASSFEHFNVHIKKDCWKKSRWQYLP